MDNMRGPFSHHSEPDCDAYDDDLSDEDTAGELPPAVIGQDERRMQVRAYNFWAGMLHDRIYPSIDSLDAEHQADFGPFSVLLDFTGSDDDPEIRYLGDKLAAECGADKTIRRLSDVPSRSLLSRITDHYMQIIANQAPVGFEAEFVNASGDTILYRGILLPFSSDDARIDYIYGVINWKQLADQQITEDLMKQIDGALSPAKKDKKVEREMIPLTDWADGPADMVAAARSHSNDPFPDLDLPRPAFGDFPVDSGHEDRLDDCLASARALAEEARSCEDRTRQALYAAIGRAYDVALAAAACPQDFAAIVADAGIVVQDRAPMTAIVKLVFGADYDKTRLAEYAAVLAHAERLGLERGTLTNYLADAQGGLKGVIAEERRLRRKANGAPAPAVSEDLGRRLRDLPTCSLGDIAPDGDEFTVLVARRLPDGGIVLLGEVADDAGLLERAAKHLIG